MSCSVSSRMDHLTRLQDVCCRAVTSAVSHLQAGTRVQTDCPMSRPGYILLSGAQGLGRSAATPQPSVATEKTNRHSFLGRQIGHKQIHAGSMY